MAIRRIALVLAGLAVLSAGCNRTVRLAGPDETGKPPITDVLTGVVDPPVNGVRQQTFRTFTLGTGGPVTVTMTSAVQTRPDGTLQTTVQMGLGVGLVVNEACVVPANAYLVTAAGGTQPHLGGSLPAGVHCVQVSDVTGQVGPVAFSVTVIHT